MVVAVEARDRCKGANEVLLSAQAALCREAWVREKTGPSPVVLFHFPLERLREIPIKRGVGWSLGLLTLTQEGKTEVSLAWAEGQEWRAPEGPQEWSEAQSVEKPEHFRAWRRRGVLVRCAMLVN